LSDFETIMAPGLSPWFRKKGLEESISDVGLVFSAIAKKIKGNKELDEEDEENEDAEIKLQRNCSDTIMK